MKNNLKNADLWRVTTSVLVVGSILSTYLFSGKRNRKNRNEVFKKQQKVLDQNLTVPANATFGVVWPVIYLGTIALAVHQALPSQRGNPRYQKALPWLLFCYTLNALFGYFFSKNDKTARVASSIITIFTLPFALILHQKLEVGRTKVPEPENSLRKSVSLYAGWLTIASTVSVGNLIIEAGYSPKPAKAARWAYAILPMTAGLGLATSRLLQDPYYLLPLSAGFTGIAAKQYDKQKGVTALTGAFASGISALVANNVSLNRLAKS